MLHGQNGRGHQYCHLFSAGHCFKGCPYCYLGFAKANVSTNKSVHRIGLLHVFLYVHSSSCLVWSVFIYKRRFQGSLGIIVGFDSMPWRTFPYCIQRSQRLGDILHLLLPPLLFVLPRLRSWLAYGWRPAFLAAIFRYLMQRMNASIQKVIISVDESKHLLFLSVYFHFFQASKSSHTVVHMNYIVSRIQAPELLQCNGFGL